MSPPRHIAALLIATLFLASPASAHPRLLSSFPPAGAAVVGTDYVSLTFSEPLILPISTITLTKAGKSIAIARKSLSHDGNTLTASFPNKLAANAYDLAWHVTSTDTHRVAGTIRFTVK